MKKLLIVFAAGVLLTSCSSTQDKEAAAEFCECVNANDASESTDVFELMESADKMTACIKAWQTKYNGKISDSFKDVLNESCPEGYTQAEAMGMFAKK